jgi:predicted permease
VHNNLRIAGATKESVMGLDFAEIVIVVIRLGMILAIGSIPVVIAWKLGKERGQTTRLFVGTGAIGNRGAIERR